MKTNLIKEFGLLKQETEEEDDDGEEFAKNHLRVAFFNLSMTLKDGNPTQVPGIDHLFVGSIGSAYNINSMKKCGITHVLCLSAVIKTKYESDLCYLRIPMVDKPDYNIGECFTQCCNFIDTGKNFVDQNGMPGKVLVHCYQGKSRSVAVCCAYLISRYGWKYSDALQTIQTVRSIAAPNSGFDKALRDLEKGDNIS